MGTNLEIVRKEATIIPKNLEEYFYNRPPHPKCGRLSVPFPDEIIFTPHESRLNSVLEREIIKRPWYDDYFYYLHSLAQLGFRMVVNARFARKFKYHAILRGGPIVGKLKNAAVRGDDCTEAYYYVGDVPETALDRIEQFKYGPITVHSMSPLPLKITKFLPRVDPVAIGWIEYPEFIKTAFGWKTRSPGGKGGCGVVLAIWDGEKEIKVL